MMIELPAPCIIRLQHPPSLPYGGEPNSITCYGMKATPIQTTTTQQSYYYSNFLFSRGTHQVSMQFKVTCRRSNKSGISQFPGLKCINWMITKPPRNHHNSKLR